MSLSRTLQYLFIAIIVTTVGFSLYQWNASRASTQKTAPNNGLVGYWSFDENTGTQAGDASGNGNTGTLTNGPTWTSGKLGQALSFDGYDDRVTTNFAQTNVTAVSLSVWVKTTSTGANGFIIDSRGGGNAGVCLEMNGVFGSPGTFQVSIDNSDYLRSIRTNATFNDGKWHHVVGMWAATNGTLVASSQFTIYVDDVVQSTTAVDYFGGGYNMYSPLTGSPMVIGYSDEQGYFNGSVDEVRIYNRALSGTEVTNLYNLGAEKLNVSPVSNLTSGLVGYWTFDGKDTPWSSSSAGTATDRSGNSNTGTLTNMSQSTSVMRGKLGQALSFDGVDDYVTLGTTNIPSRAPLSISAWVKYPLSADSAIINRWSEPGGYYNIFLTGTAAYVLYSNTLNIAHATWSTPADGWHNVVATMGGDNVLQVYIDGVYVATGSVLGWTSPSVGTPLRIGMRDTDSGPLYSGGVFDEVRIYNRALSAGEVQSLYDLGASDKVNSSVSQNQGTGRLDSGLVGYWKLDDASGTTATDSSVNANNGTLTNGPTWGTGQIRGAVTFDGTDDYVATTVSNGLSNSFTFSAWLYPTANVHAAQAAITSEVASYSNYWVFLGNGTAGGNAGDFALYDGTNNPQAFTDSALTLNQWVHLVGVRDTGTDMLYIYRDGVLQGGGVTDTTTSVPVYSNFNIGRQIYFSDRMFSGKVDEVRVYNRALSADEVSQLYRLTAPTAVDTSLKGYWSFDGPATNWTSSSAGTVADLSGSGNTGTLTNMSQSTSVTRGQLGQALSFDGTDDYIQGTGPTLSSAMSMEAWIKVNAQPGTNAAFPFLSKATTATNDHRNYYFDYRDSGGTKRLVFDWTTGASAYVDYTTDITLVPNVWYHIVWTISWNAPSVVNLYVNGVSQTVTKTYGAENETPPDTGGSQSLRIGSFGNVGGLIYWPGLIDDVRIYNRALSSTEVSALYNAGR